MAIGEDSVLAHATPDSDDVTFRLTTAIDLAENRVVLSQPDGEGGPAVSICDEIP
jgi:hypothetical protein